MTEVNLKYQVELGGSWVGLTRCDLVRGNLAKSIAAYPAIGGKDGDRYDQVQLHKHYFGSFGGWVTADYPLTDDWVVLQIETTPGQPLTAVAQLSLLQTFTEFRQAGTIYLTGRFDLVGYVTPGPRLDLIADTVLVTADAGSYVTNYGATGTVTASLPAAPAAGTTFSACVVAGYALRLDPGLTDHIIVRDAGGIDLVGTDGKYFGSSTPGNRITLVADASGDWMWADQYGLWTQEV